MLRNILKYLVNNERLVQRIAESYPVRRAAQLTVSIFYRGKVKLSDIDPMTANRLITVYRKFSQNLKNSIEDAKRQLKK